MKAKVWFTIPVETKNKLVNYVVGGRIDSDNDYEFDLTSVQLNTGTSHVLLLTDYYSRNQTARMQLEREIEETFNMREEFEKSITAEKEALAQI
jgi:hypothetical protein